MAAVERPDVKASKPSLSRDTRPPLIFSFFASWRNRVFSAAIAVSPPVCCCATPNERAKSQMEVAAILGLH